MIGKTSFMAFSFSQLPYMTPAIDKMDGLCIINTGTPAKED